MGSGVASSNDSQGSAEKEAEGLELEEEEEQVDDAVAVVVTVRRVRKELSIPSERLFLCCRGAKECLRESGLYHSCLPSSLLDKALSLVESVSSKEVSLSSRYSS